MCRDTECELYLHPDVAEAYAFSVPNVSLYEEADVAVQSQQNMKKTQSDIRAVIKDHISYF